MIFYFNSSGNPLGSIIGRVFCGSVNASETFFVCPISSDAVVSVAYSLPDGTSTHKIPMHSMGVDDGANLKLDRDGVYNVWKVDTPASVTAKKGEVVVQFYIADVDGAVVSTARSIFSVEGGVEPQELGNDASYNEIAAVVSSLNSIVRRANSALVSAFIADASTVKMEDQLVVGVYNEEDESASFIAGCGTSDENRQNGFYITKEGFAKTNKQPVSEEDVVSRGYLESAILNSIGRKEIRAECQDVYLTDVTNKRIYFIDELSSLTLLPDVGTRIGDYFYLMFKSGNVPTEFIKSQIGNMVCEEIIPLSNHIVEISGVWNGSKWVVLSHQTAV